MVGWILMGGYVVGLGDGAVPHTAESRPRPLIMTRTGIGFDGSCL